MSPTQRRTRRLVLFSGLLALGIGATASYRYSFAADHREATATTADPAADITDVYSWHANNKLYAVLAFAGKDPTANQTGTYDRDVLYTVHIDNNPNGQGQFDNTPDTNIYIRFGQNGRTQWGVQVQNLPGAGGATVEGPVETTLSAGSAKVWAGLRDDPFFFDLQGFQTTLNTGALSFSNTRDSFAGKNVTAIVLEMDLAAARGAAANNNIQVWASTGRKS